MDGRTVADVLLLRTWQRKRPAQSTSKDGTMIAATLKTLTWGTLATAVVSAALLAVGDGGKLRTERGVDASARPASANPGAAPTTPRDAATGPVDHSDSPH
jgi:hypothetical protein